MRGYHVAIVPVAFFPGGYLLLVLRLLSLRLLRFNCAWNDVSQTKGCGLQCLLVSCRSTSAATSRSVCYSRENPLQLEFKPDAGAPNVETTSVRFSPENFSQSRRKLLFSFCLKTVHLIRECRVAVSPVVHSVRAFVPGCHSVWVFTRAQEGSKPRPIKVRAHIDTETRRYFWGSIHLGWVMEDFPDALTGGINLFNRSLENELLILFA